MIEKCPECKEKIDILQIQEPNSLSIVTISSSTITAGWATSDGITYTPASKTYKCSNPKCWVTKIKESWE